MKKNKTAKIISSKKFKKVTAKANEFALYDTDFYKWTQEQAKCLKKADYSQLDLKNLAEEIISLGKNDRRALRNYLKILLLHLLKEKYQNRTSKSWTKSIRNSREQISYILEDSPSLKREVSKLINEAYPSARNEAIEETKLASKIFPTNCPWKVEDII